MAKISKILCLILSYEIVTFLKAEIPTLYKRQVFEI